MIFKTLWGGIPAPAGTPVPIVTKLSGMTKAILAEDNPSSHLLVIDAYKRSSAFRRQLLLKHLPHFLVDLEVLLPVF